VSEVTILLKAELTRAVDLQHTANGGYDSEEIRIVELRETHNGTGSLQGLTL